MSGMQTFYLICFVVGFALTIVSLTLGHLHVHVHWHGIHGIGHGTPHGISHLHSGSSTASQGEIAPLNFSTAMAFLTWFGGMGFLLSHYYRFWLMVVLGLATVSGLAGGGVVFWFMAKLLVPRQTQLDPADFELVGTVAHVSSSIRENGTGEIIYSQGGTRRTSGARSEDGRPLEKGADVVITRYDKGIAYVQRWEEFSK
jgi:membrane protein implicated in regulation of membrane protease activity